MCEGAVCALGIQTLNILSEALEMTATTYGDAIVTLQMGCDIESGEFPVPYVDLYVGPVTLGPLRKPAILAHYGSRRTSECTWMRMSQSLFDW